MRAVMEDVEYAKTYASLSNLDVTPTKAKPRGGIYAPGDC